MNQAPMKSLADAVQSRGRGQDTQLMHVTPGEVSGLQALAMAHGGSLTINPDTGLVEAGFLSSLLPMLAGGLLAATGVGAPLAAAIVGGGTGLITGDLNKGLMAGLGAFGGAGLASGLGAAGSISTNAGGILGSSSGMFGANMGAGAAATGVGAAAPAATGAAAGAVPGAVPGAAGGLSNVITPDIMAQAAAEGGAGLAAPAGAALPGAAGGLSNVITPDIMARAAAEGGAGAMGAAPTNLLPAAGIGSGVGPSPIMAGNVQQPGFPSSFKQFGSQFADATRIADSGMLKNAGQIAAGLGILSGVSGAMSPTANNGPPEDDEDREPYRPYQMNPRQLQRQSPESYISGDSSEFQYFDNVNPGYSPVPGYAYGGEVDYSSMLPQRPNIGGYGNSYGNNGMESLSDSGGFDGVIKKLLQSGAVGGGQSFAGQAGQATGMGGKGQIGAPKPSYMPPVGGQAGAPQQPPQGMPPQAQQMRPPMPTFQPGNSAPQQWGRPNLSPASMQPQGGGGPPQGMAQGGMVAMAPGGFVMDARATSEFGNGSSNAGMERLQQMGGVPLQGPGDGVSDSIPASIGSQPAAVARDEVYFPPQAVEQMGGTQQLYDMMDQAHKARQNAQRGGNTQAGGR